MENMQMKMDLSPREEHLLKTDKHPCWRYQPFAILRIVQSLTESVLKA